MSPLSIFLYAFLTFISSLHGISAVNYQVKNLLPDTPGGIRFEKEIGIPFTKETMGTANEFVWSTVFQQNNPSDRKPVDTVNVYISDVKDSYSDSWDNNINITAQYIGELGYIGNVKRYFAGLIYHEMTHVFQWNGGGHAPDGLLEGIADYARIKANYTPTYFAKPGTGKSWDEGNNSTARFLEYCDEISNGFVAKLNTKMKSAYDVNYFQDLTGKSVDQLWQDYKAKYKN